ncbi:MAG: DUF2723 domain-containing protein [Anaerolineae bacterium]|nr:DUF2723 domain-containing protein [Anaerolineae bacterium]
MTPTSSQSPARRLDLLIGAGVFVLVLGLYVATLAPGLVFGDPAEYTFVPHIWGISHPPGYALQTVLGGLWQRLIPFGSIAFRANLLSAFCGAGIAALAYGSVRALTPESIPDIRRYLPALLAAFSAATATDIWQHSIHANSHITTALLASLSVFLLLHWQHAGGETRGPAARWLYAFCAVAGLSVTHHPLLAFSFPAYIAFILSVRPGILLGWLKRRREAGVPLIEWGTLLRMVAFGLLGLSVWLYLPLRASLPVPLRFGPENTNTLNGFLDLVLARGLKVNLFHFGLADQPDRLTVFWSLLQLQASLPVIAAMLAGLAWLWRRQWRAGLLFTLLLAVNLAFILNTIQDVMAYLMTPFSALMVLAGVGLIAFLEWVRLPGEFDNRAMQTVAALIMLVVPLSRVALSGEFISLARYDEADRWVEEVHTRFEGKGEGAILLAHWEHLTPLWYAEWVEKRPLAPEDVRLVFVAANSDTPWLDNVQAVIDQGPVYVSGYQPELVSAGYRLRPTTGRLYRVLPAPADEPVVTGVPLNLPAGPLTLVGIDLPLTTVDPGAKIPLNIALQASEPLDQIIFPYAVLGDEPDAEDGFPPATFAFTTDGHFLSPGWQPGETIVERYDPRAPISAPSGEYPLYIGLRNLSTGEDVPFDDGSTRVEVGRITITEAPFYLPVEQEAIMANIANQVGLLGASARVGLQSRAAVWQQPLTARPGQSIHVRLYWTALDRPDENWKVFVQLLDANNRVVAQQDAPPLGGAFPTFLWFPKWVLGQSVTDPYRLVVPADAVPGDYRIIVGMYGFFTHQRAEFYDTGGNLSGDYYLLGTVRVEP